MTTTDDSEQQLKAAAAQVGKCPTCGGPPTRVVGAYPTLTQVVCEQGHQWEGEVTADQSASGPATAAPAPTEST